MDIQQYRQNETSSNFSATAELFSNERCLKNYYAHIIKKITFWFSKANTLLTSDKNPMVLEFGAGIGTLAAEYENQNKIKPDCIEIDPEQIAMIKNRGFTCYKSLSEVNKKYHAIYTSNVLEHIEDDTKMIENLYQKLENNGTIAIFVPAFQCLWSDMDELVGHYRRYSRKELIDKVSKANFKILTCHYVDCVGFFAWLILRLKGYKTGDITASDGSLKFFDKFIYPFSKFFDFLGCRYLFGKSLLIIAQKVIP